MQSRKSTKTSNSHPNHRLSIIANANVVNEPQELPLFVEVVQLRSGKSFGELALIKNKPRAATIKCVEDCHFAVMSKSDYEKVLQKIEQKNMNKIIEFLHQLPFFKVWTRTSLSKLQYSFEQRAFIRNQIIYKEGDTSHMVYIIKTGEFEVNKKFKREEVKEIDMSRLLGPKPVANAGGSSHDENNKPVHISQL